MRCSCWSVLAGAAAVVATGFPAVTPVDAAAAAAAAPSSPYVLPTLAWPSPLPSDWVSVADPKHAGGAKGDGKTDDTKAIQATFDLLTTCNDPKMNATADGEPKDTVTRGSTVYFPAGTFLITQPIYTGHCTGLVVIGNGATTILQWGGGVNGTMYISNGTVFGRWEGLTWDGQLKAKWGISYNSTHGSLFETRQLHRNEYFKNFLDAGISVGVTPDNLYGKKETAEALVQNCLFENNYKGIGLEDFNDYDWAIDGCTFINNSYGVYTRTHHDANWDVHSCRFENSKIADLTAASEASNVRQAVSVGSHQFLATIGGGGYHSPLQIHDCRIYNWTARNAISFDLRGPLTITNSMFEAQPTWFGETIVTMHQSCDNNETHRCTFGNGQPEWPLGPDWNAVLIEGGNTLNGHNVTRLDPGFFSGGPNLVVRSIAGGDLTSELNSATRFDRAKWPVPTKITDCTQEPYYGHPDNELVGQALQDCIDSVAAAGGQSMAYIPAGSYVLEKPLKIPAGRDFWVSGSGYATQLVLHPNSTVVAPPSLDQPFDLKRDDSWIAAPSPSFPAHFEIEAGVAAAATNVRIDGFMFKGNNWKDPQNVTHDLCSIRIVPTTPIDETNQQTVARKLNATRFFAPPAPPTPGASVYLDWLFYDGAYNASACGVQVVGLQSSDILRVGYLDMSLDVADSAEATVLVDFMTGGRLQVRGNAGKPRAGFLGIKMFAGLAID